MEAIIKELLISKSISRYICQFIFMGLSKNLNDCTKLIEYHKRSLLLHLIVIINITSVDRHLKDHFDKCF